METILPLIFSAITPFKLENDDLPALLFFGGLISDLIYGSTLGLTSLFLLLTYLFLLFYSRNARLRIRVKLAFALLFCFIYSYVVRRFFF